MQRAVVLLSGGLDSATTLALALEAGYECHCLTVEYGQRHVAEVEAAKRVARALGAQGHDFVSVDLRTIGGSALTSDIDVPKDGPVPGAIPVTYVPARNTVMLALALGLAEVVGADAVFIGVNAVDYSGYPDCRPAFIEAFEQMARLATKSGVEGRPIAVKAPLIHLSKREIVKTGIGLGVDFALTHSCYDPSPDGRPCLRCDSCVIRTKAFEELGTTDPLLARFGD